MNLRELFINIGILIFAFACFISSGGFSALVVKTGTMSAFAYSNALAVFLIVVGVLSVARMLIHMKRCETKDTKTKDPLALRSVGLIMICSILYVIGVTYIGFYVSTFSCMLFLYLGFEHWQKSKLKSGLVFAACLTLVFLVSFYFLKIYLPSGLLV